MYYNFAKVKQTEPDNSQSRGWATDGSLAMRRACMFSVQLSVI